MPTAPRLPLLAVALLLAAPLAAMAVQANHLQTAASGRQVAFDHRTGNEWWVEVVLSGPDANSVSKVEAMDTGGAWVPLSLKSWGAWAASFHIEPGHQVRFRATWTTTVIESCWFTHPAGVEQCSTTPPPPPPPTGFDATFSGVKGNEWWVQANVAGNQPIAKVDARVNCGATWRPLTLQSWGGWAASFQIPSGSKIDFRATSSTGATDLSGGYTWPSATPTTGCGGTTPPPGFGATFTNARGNQYWTEVDVSANQPIAGVEMRVEHQDWIPMGKTSWGSWAVNGGGGIGGMIEFRARATDGQHDTSYLAYLWWPDGPDPYPGPAEGVQALWDYAAGDHTTLRIDTHTTARLSAHHYSVDGGAWQPMTKLPDGDWSATGAAIPSHATVRFRATFEGTGATHTSAPFAWPPWPQPGAWAEYEGVSIGQPNDAPPWNIPTHGRMVLQDDWTWEITCGDATEPDPQMAWHVTVAPMVAEPPVDSLGDITMFMSSTCGGMAANGAANARASYTSSVGPVDAWHLRYDNGASFHDAWIDTTYGISLDWHLHDVHGGGTFDNRGWLVDTSAEIQDV
ncbi:MAG: hypothetical protein QOD77_194 [Thermoplasmata archaeon]|jgi:hypothetical protein|nr:hypothetical protein [Thermoplasmata archaeon]